MASLVAIEDGLARISALRSLTRGKVGWGSPAAREMAATSNQIADDLLLIADDLMKRGTSGAGHAAVLDSAIGSLRVYEGVFASTGMVSRGTNNVWSRKQLETFLDTAEQGLARSRTLLDGDAAAGATMVQESTAVANSGALDGAVEHLVNAVNEFSNPYPWHAQRGVSTNLASASRELLEGRRTLMAVGIDQTAEGAQLVADLAHDARAIGATAGSFSFVDSLTGASGPVLDNRTIRSAIATAHAHARQGSELLIARGLRPMRLAEVDSVLAEGRLLRTREPAALDAAERLLSEGAVVPGKDWAVRSRTANNINGTLLGREVTDGSATMRIVRKQARNDAAQEIFGWRVARLTGIDYLYPVTGRRPSGSAYIELVRGREFGEGAVTSRNELRSALSSWYTLHATDLTPQARTKWSRIDHQLSEFVDYLLANVDRHTGNGMFHPSSGELHLIDFGYIGRGHNPARPLMPTMRRWFMQSSTNQVMLDAETLRIIRRRVTPDALRQLHEEVFAVASTEGLDASHSKWLKYWKSQQSLDDMLARLDYVLSTGTFFYSPSR